MTFWRLVDNKISGWIPAEVGSLSQMQMMSIHGPGNNFHGCVPDAVFSLCRPDLFPQAPTNDFLGTGKRGNAACWINFYGCDGTNCGAQACGYLGPCSAAMQQATNQSATDSACLSNTAAPTPPAEPTCFTGDSTVYSLEQERVSMASLEAGTAVLVGRNGQSLTYEAVYGFIHSLDKEPMV